MNSSQTSGTASHDAVPSDSDGAYGRPWPGKIGTDQTGNEGPPRPAVISPNHTYGDVRFQVARMDLETFTRIKQWQRSLIASTGQKLTNSQVLRMLILSHPVPTDCLDSPQSPKE